MSSSPSIPPPADKPDDGYNPTWNPEVFPDTIAGMVESRMTLKFKQPREGRNGELRTTFEKLVVQTQDGEFIDVLCGRARLARLIVKHDPQVGDGIAITAFGPDEKGWHEYGINTVKSHRLANHGSLLEAEPSEAAKVSRVANAPLNEEAA